MSNPVMTREDAIRKAIRLIGDGSQTAMADALTEWFEGERRISPSSVNKWLNSGQLIPPHIAQAIEALTAGAVTAGDLCPAPELKIHGPKYARYLSGQDMESNQ